MSLFIEGKLFNKTGAESGGGGGGGDQHNLGWYETPTALRTAHPLAGDGDWAIVGSTDTVWVWDSDSVDWKDSTGTALVESVNGKAGVVVLDAHDVGAVPQLTTMPVAFTDNDGWVVQYIGPTNSSHTQGYFYRNKRTDLYTSTVTFQPATISGTVVACAGSSFAQFAKTAIGGDPRSIVSGTMTYDLASNLWVFVGKNSSDATVVTYQVYQEDYEDAGFTFTGTPSDGDVVAFTCDIVSAGAVYTWKQINAQPVPVTSVNGQTGAVVIPDELPSQSGHSGHILTTDGTVPGWVAPEVVQRDTMPQAGEDELGNIYQYIGTTDANYTNGYFYKCVSDGAATPTYSWTAIQVQASSGGGLPSQTGNAGKFLTTDGTDASWGEALVNTATGTDALTLLGTATNRGYAINIGSGSKAEGVNDVAIGYNAKANGGNEYSVAIGPGSIATGSKSVAIGADAKSYTSSGISVGKGATVGLSSGAGGTYQVAMGYNAQATAQNAIQIGCVNYTGATNSDANTMKVANANGNFEIMSADGTIPHARLTNAVSSTSVTIATTDWSSNTASVTVNGLTATSVVWVAPDNASQSAYLDAGVYASSQTTDTLTFTCTQTPASALTITVVYC